MIFQRPLHHLDCLTTVAIFTRQYYLRSYRVVAAKRSSPYRNVIGNGCNGPVQGCDHVHPGLLRKTSSWTHPSNHIGHGQRSDEFAFERGTAMGHGVGLEKSWFVFDLVTGLAHGNRGAQ